MTISKTYLNVPYQEKDSAKALGARWDPTNKKWYVPANKDPDLFAKWNPGVTSSELSTSQPQARNDKAVGGITYPVDKNFVPYNGDEPPWTPSTEDK